ncbi:MAG: arsenate reductase [Alphaproteobacteria bacterium]|nr:MAG: arsenate reductase [Alphaproteobacteria bacterium]
MIIYGIRNCDTCRKALKWLEEEGIEHRFHDFRKDGLAQEKVAGWLRTAGADILVNRRGTTYRKLADDEKAALDGPGAAALLTAQPTLMKRPVFETASGLVIGFKDTEKAALRKTTGG